MPGDSISSRPRLVDEGAGHLGAGGRQRRWREDPTAEDNRPCQGPTAAPVEAAPVDAGPVAEAPMDRDSAHVLHS